MKSDPIADLLTKIRNASRAKLSAADVPASKLGEQILTVLKSEGFIRSFKRMGQAPKQSLRVYLKYTAERKPVITKIVSVSKPGQRQYRDVGSMPRILGGLGRSILTTSRGVLTDREAKRQNVGGEILCSVW